MKEELSKATRTESDLIGEREVPETALWRTNPSGDRELPH